MVNPVGAAINTLLYTFIGLLLVRLVVDWIQVFARSWSPSGIVLVLPILFQAIFARSERSLGEWIGRGFDADVATLELINSGRFAGSPAGRYLHALKDRFDGPVVADLLCYLRLHIELSLRAKGVLLMRESGFDPQVDEATRAAFGELRYLGKSVGRTGLRAIRPMLGMTGKELWQLHMLDW